MQIIVLAAGQGTRLRPLTDDRPKCLVPLAGKPLLQWTIEAAHAAGIDDILVIGGYRFDQLASYPVRMIENPAFMTTNMVRTLFCAEKEFGSGFVVSYGDIAYRPEVLKALLADQSPIAVTVDRGWRSYWEARFDDPLADAETLTLDAQGFVTDIGQNPASLDQIEAQYIGLVKFQGHGVTALRDAYRAAQDEERRGAAPFGGPRSLDKLYMTDLLQGLIARGAKLKSVPINRGWVEVDSVRDLDIANETVRTGGLGNQT